jgi:hypothetical protein
MMAVAHDYAIQNHSALFQEASAKHTLQMGGRFTESEL